LSVADKWKANKKKKWCTGWRVFIRFSLSDR
jgi:hypothetical protein